MHRCNSTLNTLSSIANQSASLPLAMRFCSKFFTFLIYWYFGTFTIKFGVALIFARLIETCQWNSGYPCPKQKAKTNLWTFFIVIFIHFLPCLLHAKPWYCFCGIISRVEIMALASCLLFSKSRSKASISSKLCRRQWRLGRRHYL